MDRSACPILHFWTQQGLFLLSAGHLQGLDFQVLMYRDRLGDKTFPLSEPALPGYMYLLVSTLTTHPLESNYVLGLSDAEKIQASAPGCTKDIPNGPCFLQQDPLARFRL